jgi:hypothetical protein
MVIPLPGGRRLHVAEGELKEALLAWIKDANGAEKIARHEHAVKHRKYYVPIDIMYVGAAARGVRKLAGSPFRAKYKPSETCPVCVLVRGIERARVEEEARQRTRAASPTGSPPRSSIVWTHSGFRYLLGYALDSPYYGVWDRQAPGPPIARFPYTEHGKAEASLRFSTLEPSGKQLEATQVEGSVPPPPSSNE